MRFVHQGQHTVLVGQFDQRPQVGADAVIGRVVDQDGLGIRVCLNGGAHIRHFHPQGDAQLLIHLRINIHRYCAAQYQGIDGAFVHVAGQNDLVSGFAGGENHALYAAGGAAHHQEGMRRPEGIGRQLLRFLDDRNRMTQIVQRFHGIHIDSHAPFSQQFHQFRISPAAFVPRHIEGDYTLTTEFFQRCINGRFLLTFPVQDHPSFLQDFTLAHKKSSVPVWAHCL